MKQIGFFLTLIFFSSCTVFSQVPSYVDTNGLVGWWPFDGNANDFSGNGNNGTVNGTVFSTTDRHGNLNACYQWPNTRASGNYINLGTSIQSQLTNSITTSVWVYFDTAATADARIISTWEMGIIVFSSSPDSVTLKCTYDFTGTNMWPSTFKISKHSWHQIVFTSGSGFTRLYVDGQLVEVSSSTVAVQSSPYDWNVGRKSRPSYDGFGGKIDDLGIWNRVLAPLEITNLYNAYPCNNSRSIYYVDIGGDDLNIGSAIMPLRNIQTAIDRSCDGDTIIVEQGTYYEKISFLGKSLLVSSRFLFSNLTNDISNTIINGSQDLTSNSGITINGQSDSSYLIGFTVDSVFGSFGGAIRAFGKVKISDCVVSNSKTNGEGCGFYGHGIIENTKFTHNSGIGRGVITAVGNIKLSGCYFYQNTGIALYNWGNDIQIKNCIFNENSGNKGGAIYSTRSGDIEIINSTFYNNSGYNYSSIFITSEAGSILGSKLSVINSILWDSDTTSPLISTGNPIAFGPVNSGATQKINIVSSVVGKGVLGINILIPTNLDTLNLYHFSPHFQDITNQNFRLKSNSPLIGLGSNNPSINLDTFLIPQLDYLKNQRIQPPGSIVDLGAIESALDTACQSSLSNIYVIACDSFIWVLNSMTYNASGIYSDTLINSEGCDSIVSLNLTINTLSYQLPQDTITSCNQDSVLLDAGSGFASYNWSNGDSSQTTYSKATGMYSVQVTDSNGCSAVDSVFVSIINDSILQNDTVICKGDSVSLSVNLISFPLNFNGCVSSSAPYFGTWSLITPTGIYTNLIRKDSIFYSRSNNDVFKSNFINGPWISLNFATQIGITSPGNVIDMLEFDWGGNLFVSTAHNDLYSFDGINWNSKGLSGFGCSGAFMKKLKNNRIIVSKWGYLRDLYITDNNGTSWTNVTNGGTNDYFDIELANNGNIFVASTSGLIKKSTNNGSNWTLINSQLALSVPSCFGIEKDCDGNLYAIGNNKLYKSIDDGTTWVYLNPVPAIGVNEFEITSNGDFYIFINNNGFYRSSNQGLSWSLVTGLPINLNGRVRNLKQVDDKLLLITSQGIYAKSITQNNSVFWSTGDTTGSISVSPDSTTTYYMTISNGIHSCTDSVTVTVNNPQFQFAQDSIAGCDTVIVNAGSGWSSYSWSSGDTAQSVSFTTTGMKILTVTDSIGCTATDSIYVTVNTYVTTTVADTSCDQYTWSQTGITYGSSGTYRDTVPTAVGCDSILELVLTITNSSFSSDTVVTCESYTWPQTGVTYYTTGIYFDTMLNAVGCDSILALDLTIHYSTSSIINQTACDSFSWSQTGLTYFVTGTYPDTLLNSKGCDSVVFLNLLVYPTITPIIGAVQNRCENDPIFNFTASPIGGFWSGPGISATGSFDPTVAGVGVHTIVYTAAGQCANSDTTTIEVYDVPLVMDLIKDDECDEGIGFIQTTITGGTLPYTYLWNNGKTSKDNLRLKEGTYSLTVTDSNGCIENYVGSLLNLEDDSCDDTYLFVPNVFSPDGNGVNDVLFVDGKNILAVNLQIYNRWGNLVFESNSLTKGWDGMYQGKPVNQGVFVYMLSGRYKDGEEFEQKGTITVVR